MQSRRNVRPFCAPRASFACRLKLEELESRDLPSTFLGNQIFPADNPWNQKIDKAPVAAQSSSWLSYIGVDDRLRPDFGSGTYAGSIIGIPFNVVSGSQPKVQVVIDSWPEESDIMPVPIPANPKIENDPSLEGDRHLLVYDKDNNIVYELYNAKPPSITADGKWHAANQAVWDLNKNTFRTEGWTSADAAGLPVFPGLVRTDEVFNLGRIDHALRFTIPLSSEAYIFPASHEAGRDNPAYPPMGARFRLKESFDISGFSPTNQIILKALKEYGMIVADNGGGWFFQGEPSPLWNNDEIRNLVNVFGRDFEAVDLTPIVKSLNVTAAAPGSTITISGLNFSGGAGLTRVYFGTTAATSFVINSDSTITAVVPNGSLGTTVDVTVKSGYGTSKVSTGDRFTYQAAIVLPPSPPPPPPPAPVAEVILAPGSIEFGSTNYSAVENSGVASLSVRRLFGSDGAVSVNYTVTPSTSAGYQTITSLTGTLNFAEGQTSQDLHLDLVDDFLVNGNRLFTVTLSQPTDGASVGQTRSTNLTVVDDDKKTPGVLQLSATHYYVSEGALMASIEVTRTAGVYGRVTVSYGTYNGTARAGSDYKATSGTLVFNAGETSKTILIPIYDDSRVENDETVKIYLGRTTGGATLGTRRTATLVIVNNDSLLAADLPQTTTTTNTTLDPALLATYEYYWPWRKK